MHLFKNWRKLGGWHRLWFAFCGLSISFLIATNLIYVGPMPESYRYRDEFYENLSSEAKSKIAEINVYGLSEGDAESFVDFTNKAHEWVKVSENLPDKLKNSVLVEMPNKQVIAFKLGYPIPELEKVSKEYWNIIERYAHKQKKINPYLIKMLSDWLVLCSFLYATGIAIAWVRRGFKTHTTNL